MSQSKPSMNDQLNEYKSKYFRQVQLIAEITKANNISIYSTKYKNWCEFHHMKEDLSICAWSVMRIKQLIDEYEKV